ncbi:MAG: exopolysaccharide biosynthesis protein [Snowella sp.]|nr:exopolysaccharide biosynthesis protein [Snowella sp.]
MHLRFSQDIEALLRKAAYEPLILRDMLAVTAERGFCLMIALLALPFIFPIPPGLTGIAGLGILLLSLQMLLGFHQPWLPARVANFPFPSKIAKQLLNPVKRLSRILEKITRPRLAAIAQNRYIWKLNGLFLVWLTLLLMLPIPFTNPLPAIGILILAVAMLEADGLLMGIAYLWTILLTLGLIFLGSNLWAIADAWR